MNRLTGSMPMETAVAAKATPKQRLFNMCYLTAIGLAMVGWLSAFGWATVAVAKWLLA